MADKLQSTAELVEEEKKFADDGKLARKKWGHAIDSGFQMIPNVLFRCQHILDLDAVETVILLNITLHWWEPDDPPHPRPSVIARRMGLTTRAVERRLKDLEKKGFLKRQKSVTKNGRKVRPYDLTGLVSKLQSVSAVNLRHRDSSGRMYTIQADAA